MGLSNCVVITGSIGCGKSTVCSMLASKGYKIIDADAIGKEIANSNLSTIASLFGNDYVEEGILNREKLGKLVFSNETAKAKLEAVMHPLIKEKILKEAQKLEKDNKIYFIDIPLFFESKNYTELSPVVVVYTPRERQIQRISLRNNLAVEDVLARVNSQIDIEEKAKMADFIIDNSGEISELSGKVNNFLKEVEIWFCKNTARAETIF